MYLKKQIKLEIQYIGKESKIRIIKNHISPKLSLKPPELESENNSPRPKNKKITTNKIQQKLFKLVGNFILGSLFLKK